MLDVPHDLYTTEQTRELERLACEEYSISSSELMKRAGTSALAALKYHWPRAENILVVCGTGNNGGDGFESAVDPENPNIVYAQSQYGWLVRLSLIHI